MDAYNAIKQDITSFIRTWIKTGIIVNPQVGGDFFSNKDVISSKYSFFETKRIIYRILRSPMKIAGIFVHYRMVLSFK